MKKPHLRPVPTERFGPNSAGAYRQAFDAGSQPTLFFDPSSRVVVEANKAAVEMTGYSHEELADLRLEDLHPRSARAKVLRHYKRIQSEDEFSYDDVPLETKDNTNIPVQVRGQQIGFDDRRVVMVQLRDLGEERLLQREVLMQNLKLTALNSLSSVLNRSLQLSEILTDSLRVLMEATGTVYGEVLLYQEKSKNFRVVTRLGPEVENKEFIEPKDCPLASQVMESRQAFLYEDKMNEPRLAQMLRGKGELRAVAAVPLVSKDRVLGAIVLAIGSVQLFPHFDYDLFTSIGTQIGMAAENAMLFHRTEAQSKQIQGLNNVARIISSSLHLEEVFDSFALELENLISFDRLSVTFMDDTENYLRIFASGARTDAGWGMESIIPLVGTGPGWVIMNETHIIHPDTMKSQRFIEDQFLFEDGVRSYILLPLESRRQVLGTLGLGSAMPNAFSEDNLPLLSQLCKQVAVAIENVKLYQKAKETSILDDVSSLYNFRYFHQALDRELKMAVRHKSRLSLMFIDLDKFKQVNDTLGHTCGSKVLREIGFLLRAAIRETDIAARYGGDEFVVILPDTDFPHGKRLAERVRRLILRTPFLREESLMVRVGASLGVATYPTEAPTKDELIRIADERMYKDKALNRGKPIPRDS